MPLKIFIDTEFTSFVNKELISIGIVAESGEEFYAEVPYQYGACSEFVREAVIPLLGRIDNAHCPIAELRNRIITWLKLVRRRDEEIEICFDSQADWDLFIHALDYLVPIWCKPREVAYEINELLRLEFHKTNQLPEHHALYDALANCYAFRQRVVPQDK